MGKIVHGNFEQASERSAKGLPNENSNAVVIPGPVPDLMRDESLDRYRRHSTPAFTIQTPLPPVPVAKLPVGMNVPVSAHVLVLPTGAAPRVGEERKEGAASASVTRLQTVRSR